MDWNAFITSLITSIFTSLGGSVGIGIMVFFIIKNRLEKYADGKIQLKFDKELEDYKFKNEEKLMKKSDQDKLLKEICLEGNEKISDTINSIMVVCEKIDSSKNEGKTLYFYFGDNVINNPLEGFESNFVVLEKYYNQNSNLLPKELQTNMKESVQNIKKYIYEIKHKMKDIDTNNNIDLQKKGREICANLERCKNIIGANLKN